jgi:hypothetical protein
MDKWRIVQHILWELAHFLLIKIIWQSLGFFPEAIQVDLVLLS